MPGPEAIFFDVGGTLIEVSPSVGHVYEAECRARGAEVEAEAIQKAFDRAWVTLSAEVPRGVDRYSLFPGGEKEWWERVSSFAFAQCGVESHQRPSVDELRAAFAAADAWRVYPETRGTLDALRSQGYRLGVISNWDSRLPALLESLELQGHFERVVYSADARCEKPHPAIFARAVEEMRVSPSAAVHVGDRLDEDYAGARAAGLSALLLDRSPGNPAIRDEVERWGDRRDLVADLDHAFRRIVA